MDSLSYLAAAKLVVAGPGDIRVVTLGYDPVVLGRDPGRGGVVLDGRRVSSRHCRLDPLPRGGHLMVDLGSADGVRVNRRRVGTAVLSPGDELRVGEVVVVYLDPDAETEGLAGLLDLSSAETVTRPSGVGPAGLERQLALLERGLTVADPRSEQELQEVFTECLAGLTGPRAWRAAALVLLSEPGGLVPLATQGEPLDLAPGRADVLAALAGQRIVVGGGEPGRLSWAVPLDHAAHQGPGRAPPLIEEARGALLLSAPASLEVSPAVEALLGALVRRLALFLSNVRLRERASIDPLTRLSSRARIEQLLEHALGRARELEGSVGVVILDLDDFKQINDRHGHPTGDRVLQAVAAEVRKCLRRTDAAGRWGGDELLLVLPDADPVDAALVVERTIQAVRRSGLEPPVTLSAGVACYPHHAGNAEGLLEAADEALYASKAQGKDRVRVAGSEAPQAERTQVPPSPPAWLCSDLTGSIPLRTGSTTIGRGPTCDLVLPHPSVSRCHAIVSVSAEGWSVQDCSTNGILLNGQPVVGSATLHVDDRLSIGPYELHVRGAAEDRTELERETAPAAWISSRIEVVNLGRFLAGLAEARCTGTLVVRSGTAVGSLNLEEGRCLEAALGALQGTAALAALAHLEHGTVSFAGMGAGEDPGELERILLVARRS